MSINVTKTFLPNREKYHKYVDKIFDSGWFTNNGSLVQELTRRLEAHLEVKNLILVTNGTLALQIAYKLLDFKNEVITTPFSFVATTSSLKWEGLTPIFADINQQTLNLDETVIEKLITPKTTGIVPVHTFGNPSRVNSIDLIAKKHGLKVVYDAAHAFGVKYNGKSILSYGDVSCLSLHSTKLFHSIEGGALIINDSSLYEKAKRMISFGIDWQNTGEILDIGINAKMSEFQAAMGLCVLDEIDSIKESRKKIFDLYYKKLKNKVTFIPLEDGVSDYNYSYCPIIFDSKEQLFKILGELNKNGVFPRRYFYPSLTELPYTKGGQLCPNSEDISNRILCLPTYFGLKNTDVENITSLILAHL